MAMNVAKSILNNILTNKKVGTIITAQNMKQMIIWLNELRPYLDELEKMGYIKGTWKKTVKFKILRKITEKIITRL